MVRRFAALALGKTGNKRVVDPLIIAIRAPDELVQSGAAEALGRLGDRRAVKPLIAALRDPSSLVRAQATHGLENLAEPEAFEALATAMHDSSHFAFRGAGEALAKIGTPAVEALIAVIRRGGYGVPYAVKALGQIGDRRAVKPLVAALKDNDAYVREMAAEALERLQDPQSIGPLVDALGDENMSVYKSVGYALQGFGRAAVEPLVAAEGKTGRAGVQATLAYPKVGELAGRERELRNQASDAASALVVPVAGDDIQKMITAGTDFCAFFKEQIRDFKLLRRY